MSLAMSLFIHVQFIYDCSTYFFDFVLKVCYTCIVKLQYYYASQVEEVVVYLFKRDESNNIFF